jgi:hypothetical protein
MNWTDIEEAIRRAEDTNPPERDFEAEGLMLFAETLRARLARREKPAG